MTSDVTGWRTSSYSGGQGGNCVEVAARAGVILVRDTKDHSRGPMHRFTAAGWRAFLVGIRNGEPGAAGPALYGRTHLRPAL